MMSPSDKNHSTANGKTNDVCTNKCSKMNLTSSSSNLDVGEDDIPEITAWTTTNKCSNYSNDSQCYPGAQDSLRLNMFVGRKQQYKAGSKINKLADMLAKRSQNLVGVTQNNLDLTTNKCDRINEPNINWNKSMDNHICEQFSPVDLFSESSFYDKTEDCLKNEEVKRNRRKSVPNQAVYYTSAIDKQNSKSCNDLSLLFDTDTVALNLSTKDLRNDDELETSHDPSIKRTSPRNKKMMDESDAVNTEATVKKPKKLNKKNNKKKHVLVESSTQTTDIVFTVYVPSTTPPDVDETVKQVNMVTPPLATSSFLCLYCDRSFQVNASRKLHENKVHVNKKKTSTCQYCTKKKFIKISELKNHLIKDHNNSYFYCLNCDRRFLTQEELDTHQECNTQDDLDKKLNSCMKLKTRKTNEDVTNDEKRNRTVKNELRVEISNDNLKKPLPSPRSSQKISPRECKTEEQLLEMEMLFYNQLSNNIQENLNNHLDGKIDKNGHVVRTETSETSVKNVMPLLVSNVPVVEISRAPSPYQTRSKTPNPLPTTAKKFKKLPNWQQKFWEKYNFPANYRYEHRFWDKDYQNGKPEVYLKDLCSLDIKTQITMRNNINRLEEGTKVPNEDLTTKKNDNFPSFLSLVPKQIDLDKQKKQIVNSSKTDKPETPQKLKESNKKKETVIGESECYPLRTRRKLSLDSSNKDKKHIITRHRSNIDVTVDRESVSIGQYTERRTSLDLDVEDSNETESISIADDDDSVFSVNTGDVTYITGEWVRSRSYLCGACCEKFTNWWELEDHKWTKHPNVYCTHYEFEDEKIDKLFQKNENSTDVSDTNKHKLTDLYKRYLQASGALCNAPTARSTNYPERCTKCGKTVHSSSELHKHMLDCGGDTTWFLTMYTSPVAKRNQRRWRPFGSRRRKQMRQQGVKRNIQSTPTLRSYNYQPKIRSKPGDGESIQKMLANLPEKRIRRAINFDEIKTRSQATIQSNRLLRKRFRVPFSCGGFIRSRNKVHSRVSQLANSETPAVSQPPHVNTQAINKRLRLKIEPLDGKTIRRLTERNTEQVKKDEGVKTEEGAEGKKEKGRKKPKFDEGDKKKRDSTISKIITKSRKNLMKMRQKLVSRASTRFSSRLLGDKDVAKEKTNKINDLLRDVKKRLRTGKNKKNSDGSVVRRRSTRNKDRDDDGDDGSELSEMPVLNKETPLSRRSKRKSQTEIPVLKPCVVDDSLVPATADTPSPGCLKIVKKVKRPADVKGEFGRTRSDRVKHDGTCNYFLEINAGEIDKGRTDETESDDELLINLKSQAKETEMARAVEEEPAGTVNTITTKKNKKKMVKLEDEIEKLNCEVVKNKTLTIFEDNAMRYFFKPSAKPLCKFRVNSKLSKKRLSRFQAKKKALSGCKVQVKLKEPTLKIPNNVDIRSENKWQMLEPPVEVLSTVANKQVEASEEIVVGEPCVEPDVPVALPRKKQAKKKVSTEITVVPDVAEGIIEPSVEPAKVPIVPLVDDKPVEVSCRKTRKRKKRTPVKKSVSKNKTANSADDEINSVPLTRQRIMNQAVADKSVMEVIEAPDAGEGFAVVEKNELPIVTRKLRRILSRELAKLNERSDGEVEKKTEVQAGEERSNNDEEEVVRDVVVVKKNRKRGRRKVGLSVGGANCDQVEVTEKIQASQQPAILLLRSGKRREQVKSVDVRKRYEEQLKVKKLSFKRTTLKLFKFNKKHVVNTGRQGVRLFTQEYFTNKENNLFIPLADIPFLTAQVKENPVQVIQCSTKQLNKKPVKLRDVHVKVSLPLEAVSSLNLVNLNINNNNIGDDENVDEQAAVLPDDSVKVKITRSTKEVDTDECLQVDQSLSCKAKVIDKIFYCEICKTYYYSSSQLKNHKLSNRHKLKEMEANEPATTTTTRLPEVEEDTSGVDVDKLNEDTCEMPVLEGPFIENVPAPPLAAPPPLNENITTIRPADQFLNLDERTLRDLQSAIGCTDEEMYVLTHLGEQPLTPDILDLDQHAIQNKNKENIVENGLCKFDLKKRIADALDCLLNKTVVNFLNCSVSTADSIVFLKHLLNNRLVDKGGGGGAVVTDSDGVGGCNLKNQIRARFITKVNVDMAKDKTYVTEDEHEDCWYHHEDIADVEPCSSQFLCSDCGINFSSPKQVLDHQKAEHQVPDSSSSTTSDLPDRQPPVKQGRRSKKTVEEFKRMRELAENELKKLDRKETSKRRKGKWGMEGMRITLERDSLPEGSEAERQNTVSVKSNIDLVPKLDLTKKSNVVEFKLIQKTNPGSRFMKIIENKNYRMSQRFEEDVGGARKEKSFDVYDFNESESDTELLSYSSTKKSIDVKLDEYDSDDNLPLARCVKKSDENGECVKGSVENVASGVEKTEAEGERCPKTSDVNDDGEFSLAELPTSPDVVVKNDDTPVVECLEKPEEILKDDEPGLVELESKTGGNVENLGGVEEQDKEDNGILEKVEYLLEQIEHDAVKGDCVSTTTVTSEVAGLLSSPVVTAQDFKIKVPSKYLQLDQLITKDKEVCNCKDKSPVYDDSRVTQDLHVSSTTNEPDGEDEEDSIPLVYISRKPTHDDEDDDDNDEDDGNDGNVILGKNDSSSSSYEDSDIGETQPMSTEKNLLDSIVMEKEDVVIVCCTKKDEDENDTDSDSTESNSMQLPRQGRKRRRSKTVELPRKKKIIPSLSATLEENFTKNESSESNKEEIVKKIWKRKKLFDGGEEETGGEREGEEEEQKIIEEGEIGKDMIMKKIWSRKRPEEEEQKQEEAVQINQTEVSTEIVIKCGPKPIQRRKSLLKKTKKGISEDTSSKNTIMKKIWSGKCSVQTKAALKTYDSDLIQAIPPAIVVVEEQAEKEAAEVRVKKRGRPAHVNKVSVNKRRKSDDESSDDLDSLLDEIERENIEKAVRLEFLKLRRSDSGLNNYNETNQTISLFTENLTNTSDLTDKKKRRPRKVVKKKMEECVTVVDEKINENTLDSTQRESLNLHKNRKHRKHRHKHHHRHHKHKHKKSKHHKCLIHKQMKKHSEDEDDDDVLSQTPEAAKNNYVHYDLESSSNSSESLKNNEDSTQCGFSFTNDTDGK